VEQLDMTQKIKLNSAVFNINNAESNMCFKTG